MCIILDYGSQNVTIVTDLRISRQNGDSRMIKASRQCKCMHIFES